MAATGREVRAVVINPMSASGRTAGRWESIVEQLRASSTDDATFEPHLTRCEGDAIRVVREQLAAGVRRFVVLGGDGTMGEALGGCVRADGTGPIAADIELAIIHQGTGGDHARGLGIPHDTAGAVAVATQGHPRAFDVGVARYVARDGSAGVRAFGSTANVGMSSEVVAGATGRLKRFGKSGAFAIATVWCIIRNRARPLLLTLDARPAEQHAVVDVVIANNTHMGGGMLVAPDAVHDDGLFDLVRIDGAGRIRLLRTFPKIYSGRHVRDPLVTVERCASVAIEAAPGGAEQGVVLDGELVGSTPARFTILPAAVRVLVPRG